jgi:hypothetical protein
MKPTIKVLFQIIDFQTIKENKYNDNGKKFMSNNLLLINNARIFFQLLMK